MKKTFRPSVWWSPTEGVIEQVTPSRPGDEPRFVRTNDMMRHVINIPDDAVELVEAKATAPDDDAVTVTRAELVAGIIVGIGGEHDPVPPQHIVDRAADLIIRYARRRAQSTMPAPIRNDNTATGQRGEQT